MAKSDTVCLVQQTTEPSTSKLLHSTSKPEYTAQLLNDTSENNFGNFDNESCAVDTPRYDLASRTEKSDFQRFEDGDHFEFELPLAGLVAIECTHWLEVLDPLHRYGTFLRPYYDAWLSIGAPDSFFNWLDNGDGARMDLKGALGFRGKVVSREVLERSRVQYCTEKERESYRVIEHNGRLVWASENAPGGKGRLSFVNTGSEVKWIFVIDVSGELYIRRKRKGNFHHSSFTAGGPVLAAGRIVVDNGTILCIGHNSGHYKTTWDQLLFAMEDFFRNSSLQVVPPVACAMHDLECIRIVARPQSPRPFD